ncbi:Tubulinyl-Tyr carboxypeptidase 1 [Chytriomyces hyalinus]|nr:Tubulinyl-Tyr carboxypeptidase 1 [Chytriomyces hyalinus]
MQSVAPKHFDAYYASMWDKLEPLKCLAAAAPTREIEISLSSSTAKTHVNSEDAVIAPSFIQGNITTMEQTSDFSKEQDQILVDPLQNVKNIVQGNRNVSKIYRIPKLPSVSGCIGDPGVVAALTSIQKYLDFLGYNHFGSLFQIRKGATGKHLMNLAAEIVRFGLPIKCLEAVVVAVYLSNDILEVDRYALSFKTRCEGSVYRHIVLAIKYKGKFGALGLSRRRDLMDKSVSFETLADLVEEYRKCYSSNFHSVAKVKVGMLIPHDHTKAAGFPWPDQIVKGATFKIMDKLKRSFARHGIGLDDSDSDDSETELSTESSTTGETSKPQSNGLDEYRKMVAAAMDYGLNTE